jgi:hypothetical protein
MVACCKSLPLGGGPVAEEQHAEIAHGPRTRWCHSRRWWSARDDERRALRNDREVHSVRTLSHLLCRTRVPELTPAAATRRSRVARDGVVAWNDAVGVIELAQERQASQLAIAQRGVRSLVLWWRRFVAKFALKLGAPVLPGQHCRRGCFRFH